MMREMAQRSSIVLHRGQLMVDASREEGLLTAYGTYSIEEPLASGCMSWLQAWLS